jgi:type VI secretion system protein ImpK
MAGPDIEGVVAGDGPLAIAAAPLLHLLARLRSVATAPDPDEMREITRRELRAFERRARETGVATDQLRQAHYALCATLDDMILNTPWGSKSRWRDEPLSRSLHDDSDAGSGFFKQLRAVRDTMPGSRPVIELMFLCLSLGMMGPYRTAADGPAQLERVRHRVFELITGAAPPLEALLAPNTAGIDARATQRRVGVPVWVAASVGLAAVVGVYVWLLTNLNAASDTVYQTALAEPPATMPALVRPAATPPPPPPPEPPAGPADRLRVALRDVGQVQVLSTPASTTLRLPARLLFPQPNATIAPGPALERVAEALKAEPGPIRVLAYWDTTPVHSVAFPSSFALTTARANAVRAALIRVVPNPSRVVAEGRAGADPIAPETTADGREHNRRVDIVLPSGP